MTMTRKCRIAFGDVEPLRCQEHGCVWDFNSLLGCGTEKVLEEVLEERARQFRVYGTNSDLEDGTGRMQRWLQPLSYETGLVVESLFRKDYEEHSATHGKPTWMHLIREEVAEAFLESDPERLREELIQVAALCVSWAEKISERRVPS